MGKHTGSIPAYLHGMKWNNTIWSTVIRDFRANEEVKGYSFEGAGLVNCREPTWRLKQWCGQTEANPKCTTSYEGNQVYGRHVTWDFAGQYEKTSGPVVFVNQPAETKKEEESLAHSEYTAILDDQYADAINLKMELKRRE